MYKTLTVRKLILILAIFIFTFGASRSPYTSGQTSAGAMRHTLIVSQMNAKQKYADQRAHATDNCEQSVNQNPSGTLTDAQLQMLIKSGLENMHKTVGDFLVEAEAASSLAALTHVWSEYLDAQTDDGDEDYCPTNTYQIKGLVIDHTYTIMRIMCFLTALSEKWSSIERLKKSNHSI